MEQKKHILLSAIGVGVGVGLGLVSGQTVSRWSGINNYCDNNGWATAAPDGITGDQIQLELLRLIIPGKDSQVSFDDFPYYLRFNSSLRRRFARFSFPLFLVFLSFSFP